MIKEPQQNTFILVRHGESDFNLSGIIQGQLDSPRLTARGEFQAEAVGNFIKGCSVNKIYTSPLRRAFQTAEIISDILDINKSDIIKDNDLIEIDFHSWTNCSKDHIRKQYADQYNIWRRSPYNFEIESKYPVREIYTRISRFVADINKNASGINLIVGHKGSISAIISCLLNLPSSHHHFLQIDRGSVSVVQERLRTEDGVEYELLCANECPSLKPADPVGNTAEIKTKSHGEVYLVRHGQTASNLERKYQGSKNIPLSEIGKEGISALSKSFLVQQPIRIVSSPLLRAKQSAQILAQVFRVSSISERKDMHEYLYGVWEGMTEDEVQQYRSSEYYQWKAAPISSEIPQAEHINDAYNRCGAIWEYFEQDIKNWGGGILSIAHDVVNRLLICNALDLPANYIWSFKQTNASVTIIAVKDYYDCKLAMLNHSPYTLSRRLFDEWL